MTDSLKRIVTFTDVLPGGTVTLPHNLQVAGVGVKPDEIKAESAGFAIIGATQSTLTVMNTTASTASNRFLCEAWHPIERHFGQSQGDGTFGQHLDPQPFWRVATIGGGGGGASPEYFSVTNNSGVTVLPGSPMTPLGARGDASLISTSAIAGLVLSSTAATLATPLQCSGALVLPAATWDAVTGQSGGLTSGARYWLGASPGTLSTAAAILGGQGVVSLGVARDATTLLVEIQQPILL